jgi:hypothetical protein
MTTKEIDDLGKKKNHEAPYDTGFKMLPRESYQDMCAWMGEPVPDDLRVSKEVDLAARPLRADLLIHAAPNRLIHVEFETRPDGTIGVRMFHYASMTLRLNKNCRLEQHVLVLGPTGNPPGVWEQDGVRVEYKVHKLREKDPEVMLASLGMAPFAVLGRAENNGEARIRLLSRALTRIWQADAAEDYRDNLMYVASTFAEIYLSGDQVDVAWKESKVPYASKADFVESRYLRNHINKRCDETRKETEAEMLAAVLRKRFGDASDLASVAARLVSMERFAAIDTIFEAGTLDELRG